MTLSVQIKYVNYDPDKDLRAKRAVGRGPDHSGFYFPGRVRDLSWDVKTISEAEQMKALLRAAGFESAEILLLGETLQ
jgi:hypothetical protein